MSIDSLVEDWLGDQAGGAAVLVLQHGKVVHKAGYGLAEVAKGLAPNASTIFELASCSKHMTGVAIMMLAEQGKLSYDDPITKYFPFPEYGKDITIRHLLHHTGGLTDYFGLYEEDEDAARWEGSGPADVTRAIAAALAEEEEPDFEAGEKFDYSNSGYVLLGAIASKAAGKPLPRFMQDEAFGPLGMTRTYFNDGSRARDPNQAQGYEEDAPFETTPLDTAYGDGGARTTLDDLVKWDAALDSHKLVSQKTQALGWSSGTLNDGEETGYGFGWFVGDDGVNHEGAYGGFRTSYSKDTETGVTVIILANFAEADFDTISDAIAELVAGEEGEEDEDDEDDEDEEEEDE